MKKYILSPPEGTETFGEYSTFVTPWCVFDETSSGSLYMDKLGEFSLEGTCTHPDVVEVV